MNTEQQEITDTWLDGEPPCESAHTDQCSTCTIHVYGRKHVACRNRHFNICQASYLWNLAAIAEANSRCAHCGRPCDDCWRIVPI